ncbi:hypothetical protein AXY43_10070 [Clostridium sp. MF28]|uniref:Uncharacterized protein n=1 Tax=Clostridium diolis TaxID=223919 RepID=A0AAV3VUW7_9CLOT|nr:MULTISPECIES: hypothetical protein [Clostridium]AVK48352.1 hypothetical protein AXY43_10070 [Clostridium sp. MF28]PSM55219.1 hypothetical protein C4L39_24000 [Clostridium diolis]QES75393.1 hypothetical protein F3K33_22340 [Clostridium diolis]GEA29378.1 hypothetical protein CDIOL_03010 [Clostridium diolis]
MYESKIQELIVSKGIDYCIISYLDNNGIKFLGEMSNLKEKDLPKQLFGDLDTITNLNNSLIGQEMPVTWKQGEVKGIVCKPKADVIIGLFYNEYRSLFDSIDFCNEITLELLKIFK